MEAILVGTWGCEEGTPFSDQINNGRIQNLVILHEGGFKSLTINNSTEDTKNRSASVIEPKIQPANIIKNSDFSQPFDACWWVKFGDCEVEVISGSTGVGFDNENYVIVSKREDSYSSIAQDIAGEVCVGCFYQVLAHLSVKGGNGQEFMMCATVQIEDVDSNMHFLHIGRDFVKNGEWKRLDCCFRLNTVPKHAFFYINGPPPCIDLCIGPVSILPITRHFAVSLDKDEYLTGITGYYRKIQNGMSEVISSLTFLSNLAEYGPYGSEGGSFFSFKMINGEIIGFHGTCDNYLNSIGCHVKISGSSVPVAIKKKVAQQVRDQITQTGGRDAATVPGLGASAASWRAPVRSDPGSRASMIES